MQHEQATQNLLGLLEADVEEQQIIDHDRRNEDPYQVKPLFYEQESLIQSKAIDFYNIVDEFIHQNYRQNGALKLSARRLVRYHPFEFNMQAGYGANLLVTIEDRFGARDSVETIKDPQTGLDSVVEVERFNRTQIRTSADGSYFRARSYHIPIKTELSHAGNILPKTRFSRVSNTHISLQEIERAKVMADESLSEYIVDRYDRDISPTEFMLDSNIRQVKAGQFLLATTLPFMYASGRVKRRRIPHEYIRYENTFFKYGSDDIASPMLIKLYDHDVNEERGAKINHILSNYGATEAIGVIDAPEDLSEEELRVHVEMAKQEYIDQSEIIAAKYKRVGDMICKQLR